MIIATNLGKKYRVNQSVEARDLREDFMALLQGKKKSSHEEFWALRDLNLEIHAGEIVGIVGSNGSGKSTLLKLFSRVTCPTEGQIELSGRVGALLEVGTGFHTELTGRENIFLSGAILGMHRKEVKRHLEEIIAFSEIEAFLDTPVKKYSSGMLLRLAFAVIAHLRSEILIVDEIFSVGDQEFQRKCLEKMKKIAHEGRTVIFVSHQLENILDLCTRALWLEKGRLLADADTKQVINLYQESSQDPRLESTSKSVEIST